MEFRNQTMVLEIDLRNYAIFIKYISGLSEYIRREMKLLPLETISEASIKAIAIEGKLKKKI